MFPSYYEYYKGSLVMTEGRMQYLFDHRGTRYLDLIGGISSIAAGHCHPRITAALQKQAQKLVHTSTIYLNEPQALYAKALAEKCPPGLDRIFLMNSGTEVNNTAVMLMRLFTRQNKVYSLRHCYHGNLTPLTAIGYWISPTEKGPGFERMAFPGTYQANYEGANKAEFYAQELKELIQDTSHGFIAGFIAEPVMGAAGVYTLPEGFLKKAFEVVRAHKGLCVADEVQTGFGRLGSSFWGSVDQHALPDMITMAKSIGNGYPLAALATTQEISDALSKSQFFSTYGADPIACTAGLENLRIIEEEGLQENARARGEQLLAGLARIMGQSHTIGSVRGKGLMLSLEFVKDKETRQPNPDAMVKVFDEAVKRQVLLGKGGFMKNVIRIQPPMCLTPADVDYALAVLEDIVKTENL